MRELDQQVRCCVGCHGMWLPIERARRLLYASPLGPSIWWRAELVCPDSPDHELLIPHIVDNVTIDVCPDHGMFFDAEELAQLLGAPDDQTALARAL
ncbi:MAG: hypothetical protein QM831_45175 [Kofleriaceae bacterium]